MPHVARHALTWKYAGRERRGANRTLHLKHVTVRLGTAAEAVTPNDASEATALGGSDHVDKLLVVEDVNQNAVASLDCNCFFAVTRLCRLDGDLFDHLDGRNIRLGK